MNNSLYMGMIDYNEIVRRNVYRKLEGLKAKDPQYSQAWLARKMGLSSPQQLNNNLRGRRGLARIISRLAEALEMETNDLFYDETTEDEKELLSLYRQVLRIAPSRKQSVFNYLRFLLNEAHQNDNVSTDTGTNIVK